MCRAWLAPPAALARNAHAPRRRARGVMGLKQLNATGCGQYRRTGPVFDQCALSVGMRHPAHLWPDLPVACHRGRTVSTCHAVVNAAISSIYGVHTLVEVPCAESWEAWTRLRTLDSGNSSNHTVTIAFLSTFACTTTDDKGKNHNNSSEATLTPDSCNKVTFSFSGTTAIDFFLPARCSVPSIIFVLC